jgi:hypothetical protein
MLLIMIFIISKFLFVSNTGACFEKEWYKWLFS